MNILGIVTGGVSDLISGWFETKKAKQKSDQELAINVQDHKSNWETQQAEASKHSWKDEYWTLVLSVPLVLAFVPKMADYALAGFETIKEMPDWYVGLVFIAVTASFGVKATSIIVDKFKRRS